MTTGTTPFGQAGIPVELPPPTHGFSPAAMEPRRDDGDDPDAAWREIRTIIAAMEPRRDDGDDGVGDEGVRGAHHAAMEPRRDDGDDPAHAPATTSSPGAAMEPRRDDGDDLPSRRLAPCRGLRRRNGAPS